MKPVQKRMVAAKKESSQPIPGTLLRRETRDIPTTPKLPYDSAPRHGPWVTSLWPPIQEPRQEVLKTTASGLVKNAVANPGGFVSVSEPRNKEDAPQARGRV